MPSKIVVPDIIVKEICDKYNNGKSVLALSKEFPYSYDVVHRVIRENNIEIRNNGAYATKYNCNTEYFKEIDSEQKAYWLGFIYADGYVSKIEYGHLFGLALAKKDIEHIEKFKKDISSNHPIHSYNATKCNSPYSRLVVNNETFCNHLISKGVVTNKTDILKFPSQNIVPSHLTRHFIRGYFDGDGSIVKTTRNNKYVFCTKTMGTIEFLISMHKNLPTRRDFFNPSKRHEESKANNYCMELGGNIQAYNILRYMYQDSNVHLDRKYKYYEEIRCIYG